MAFEGYSYNNEVVGDTGNGEGNIQTSGLYPILIERLEYKETDNSKYSGGLRKEFVIAYKLNDKKGYLYGLPINKIDGDLNLKTQKVINNLMTILKHCKDLAKPVKEVVTRASGDSVEVLHFKELANKEVIVYVQAKYRRYQNKIYKDLEIIDFFDRKTKASVTEFLGKDPNTYGKRYEKMKAEGFDTHISYEGVSEEEAQKWEEQRRNAQQKNTNSSISKEVVDDELPF